MKRSLEFQNSQVLNLVQALLGCADSCLRALSIDAEGKVVKIFFFVDAGASNFEELADIIATDYEAYASEDGWFDVESQIEYTNRDLGVDDLPGRAVFLRP